MNRINRWNAPSRCTQRAAHTTGRGTACVLRGCKDAGALLLFFFLPGAYAQQNPVPFSRGIMTDIETTDRPKKDEIVRSIVLTAARGEYEPFSLALYSERPGTWRVSVSGLKGPDGVIPASEVEVAALHFGLTSRKVHVKDWILKPGIKVVSLQAKASARLWLTVHVPEAAHAGQYAGALTFSSGERSLSLPIRLEVFPFRLRPVPGVDFFILNHISPYGQYYRSLKNKAAVKPKTVAFYRELQTHGMTGINPKSSDFPYKEGYIDGLIAEVEAAREAGFTNGKIVWGMLNLINAARKKMNGSMTGWEAKESLRRLKVLHERVAEETRKRGWQEVLFKPVDEPGSEYTDRQLLLRSMDILYLATKELHKLGRRAFLTISEPMDDKHNRAPRWSKTPDEMRKLVDRARPYLNIRCFGYGYPQGKTNLYREMADAKKRGHKVWIYYNDAILKRNRYMARGYYGLWGWKTKLDGLSAWTYPGARTVQFELVREGIDDYKYLAALERLIKKKAGTEKDRKTAQAFLRKLSDSIRLNANGFIRERPDAVAGQQTPVEKRISNWSEILPEPFKATLAKLLKKLAPQEM